MCMCTNECDVKNNITLSNNKGKQMDITICKQRDIAICNCACKVSLIDMMKSGVVEWCALGPFHDLCCVQCFTD